MGSKGGDINEKSSDIVCMIDALVCIGLFYHL